jgi:hypothetical protein
VANTGHACGVRAGFSNHRKQKPSALKGHLAGIPRQSDPRPSSRMEDLTIRVESCALCRRPFPTQILDRFGVWQSFARAGKSPSTPYITSLTLLKVFCLDLNHKESIELTSCFHLPGVDDDLDVPLSGHLRTVTISRDQRSSQPKDDRTAFCFYEWCYLYLNRKLAVCNKFVIFELARTITPDPTVWEEVCERRRNLDSMSIVQMLAGYSSPLLSSLPLELRINIWQHTELQSKCGAFLVANKTSRLARHLRPPLPCYIALKRGSRISAEMISVFGTEYIQVLKVDDATAGDSKVCGWCCICKATS